MGGSFCMDIAFGVCVKKDNYDEAEQAVEGLDALQVIHEAVTGIPRCSYADSEDSFISFKLPTKRFCVFAHDMDVDFDVLEAIMKDNDKMAQYRTCLERLGWPYEAPKVFPVVYISY